ncbi:lytic polysaccharide monooxygenase [Pseudomonas sp. MAFF 301514]|uniref:Lytic polysaccharide monooxygenase n=1 Tax=Pseudomonas allii TaxID=2740531 RepID=A0A7Y8RQ45_9PSED|nr:lytic polysaccharide monooxygenase [Pseudomonas allii]NWN50313.1 lytic polysaccharide monooxygenase [Pseudomonas allii]NWN63134.1 lytic polysaccharide monooxygenase [Pseudomonas allii]
MRTLMRYAKYLTLCLLAAIVSVPVVSWGHGFIGSPIDRQSNCKSTGGHWSGYINDDGCRTAAAIHQTDAEKAYPTDQFHEFSINTDSATTPIDQILNELKPNKLCSVNDERKASMSVPTSDWTKTPLTSGSTINVELFMTAIHVPSRAFVFITKPGFNSATTPVSSGDLVPLGGMHTITSSDVKQPPAGTVPKGLWASGLVTLPTAIPNGLNGPAVIVTVWARDDDKGETFVMCSDVTFGGGQIPVKRHLIGPFVDPATQTAKPGDEIRHRVINKGVDVSDKKVTLTTHNLAPGQWSLELKKLITNSDVEIGEEQNGSVVFNTVDPLRNHVFYKEEGAMQNMTVIDGGGENPGTNPTAPVANFQGPTEAVEGDTVTFDGGSSIGYNGPLTYRWATNANAGASPTNDQRTFSFKVRPYVAGNPQQNQIVKLGVYDVQNRKNDQKEIAFVIKKAGDDGDFPQWILNGGYKSGSQVSNLGVKYRCKQGPAGAWCGQNENEPGKPGSSFWQRAWDVVP